MAREKFSHDKTAEKSKLNSKHIVFSAVLSKDHDSDTLYVIMPVKYQTSIVVVVNKTGCYLLLFCGNTSKDSSRPLRLRVSVS